jgi:hypothetical protein
MPLVFTTEARRRNLMANPLTLTLTAVPENGAVNEPAGDTIDTDGIVPLAAGGATERILLEVINNDDAALTVKIKAGVHERAGIGDLSIALAATGDATAKRIIGGLESARFAQKGGGMNIEFDAASGAPNATVRAYRLPRTL